MKAKPNKQSGSGKGEQLNIGLTIPICPVLQGEARARGWNLFYLPHWEGILPPSVKLHGALVKHLPDSQPVNDLRKQGCVCVRVGNFPHPNDKTLPAVLPDLEAHGILAAEHFHERGFKHVAFWGHVPWAQKRSMYEGLRKRAEQLGMACHLYRFDPGLNETKEAKIEQRRAEFATWISGLPKPVGLFASGDWFAARYCIQLNAIGLKIPEDVALVSQGTRPEICNGYIPTISYIQQNEDERLHIACEWLQRLLQGGRAPIEPIMVAPHCVIERESTNTVGTSDPDIKSAVKYIWEHYSEPLSVDDLAQVVGLSRRTLQRRFRAEVGRGVVEELTRKRLAGACKLLQRTDEKIIDIALRTGFPSPEHLHRVFKRAFGITPRQYRRREQHNMS